MPINEEHQNVDEARIYCFRCRNKISLVGIFYLTFLILVVFSFVYIQTFKKDMIVNKLNEFTNWIEEHYILGTFTFFVLSMLAYFLCLPQLNLGIISGFILTKILGFSIGLLLGIIINVSSYFIAGILSYYLTQFLFFNCFR